MNLPDICQEARDQVDATSVSMPDAKLLRRLNAGYEFEVGEIINADGTWQFDDSRYTNLPIGVATMIDGQSNYTFDSSMLEIENVKIKDINGVWHIIKPWDQSQSTIPLENFLRYTGFPVYYDKEGNTISLLPPPKGTIITLVAGLKIQFKRTANIFTLGNLSDSTVIPGFASPYHMLLPLRAALPYAMTYKKDRVQLIQSEILRLHTGLINHYAQREKDRRKVLKPGRILHR